ncbi:protein S-acyltransferase 18 [Andrographis paniculata]|uniref:protein S-acyltransferase 18 n=1 Tax=Andrographis paniculata TaxID=175694 RepID=UPI0021E8A358|nr:protein S-acyltransferase 18 [Andrographis paniculata]
MSIPSSTPRRHGWQRPLHSLQIVGISVYCFLVAAFYCFLGLFLGNRIAEISVNSIFSFSALSVALLFIRCAATDPGDKSRFRFRKKKKKGNAVGHSKLNYGYVFSRILLRFFKRMERKILRTCIRRKYLDPWNSIVQMEPLIPFPLVVEDDSFTPSPKDNDVSFCALCDFEVNRYSKHCRTCNRCVEGFDHHCRWLNNCVGKKNYTTFILLMVIVLIMLIVEGGTGIAVFARCFADREGIEKELNQRHYGSFPRGALAAFSVILVMVTIYSAAALGQLLFFHVLLIRKGITTYDYILAMKEANQSMEMESFEDSDFTSDDDDDDDENEVAPNSVFSPEQPAFISRIICKQGKIQQNPQKLSIMIDREPNSSNNKKEGFRASIDPWKLIKLTREKALVAREKRAESDDPLKPLQREIRSGPLAMKPDSNEGAANALSLTPPFISTGGRLLNPPLLFSSPRRRLSSSPTLLRALQQQRRHASGVPLSKHEYRSDLDLKLAGELETTFLSSSSSGQEVASNYNDKNHTTTNGGCSGSEAAASPR